MNICHEGGSIVTFTDAWPPSKDSDAHSAEIPEEWLDYYRARERMERAAAKGAGSSEARRVHQALAQAYAQTIRHAGRRPHE
jgi:hypothetical protein